MAIPEQTAALLKSARQIYQDLPADAVLILAETGIDWEAVRGKLGNCRLLIAAQGRAATAKLKELPGVELLELDPVAMPIVDRMSLALLRAVATEQLQPGAHVVVLYNGIAAEQGRPEPIDSLSVIHLGEHLERMSAHDLRMLDTRVPLETLRLVVDLATEIGREGRENKPVGALFVVGDTKKVLSMCRPINFNPFRGYNTEERDLRDRRVREQIKDLAQLDGAILVGRDGVAVAGCMYIDVPAEGITLSKGLGSRHWTAAAVSRKTQAIAVVVSQSSGTVRIFQNGQVVLHIEPLARPHVWQPFHLETADDPEPEIQEPVGD
ncbi:MAG: diadenylate cyclase [Gemmataceae bacterium]|nr:diadenylate cyclase [Gemmataceae bacterium]